MRTSHALFLATSLVISSAALGCATTKSDSDRVRLAVPEKDPTPDKPIPPWVHMTASLTSNSTMGGPPAQSQKQRAKRAAKRARRSDLAGKRAVENLRRVHFAEGSAAIDLPTQARLGQVATFLRNHPNMRVVAVGHTGIEGDPEENRSLATLRAYNVRKVLLALGARSEQVTRAAVGQSAPLVDGPHAGELGEAANRRVEFYVMHGVDVADGSWDNPVDWRALKLDDDKVASSKRPATE